MRTTQEPPTRAALMSAKRYAARWVWRPIGVTLKVSGSVGVAY
jgi:hypothetical protein